MRALGLVLAAALLAVGGAAPGAEDVRAQWESAFPIRAAPERVYFRARYLDLLARTHELQAWREGDVRLRRKTDDAIDLYVEKSASGEYEFQLVDHIRRTITRARLTTLYQIGAFSDWLGLAHVLRMPRAAYSLAPPPSGLPARADCRWARLEIPAPVPSTSEICWSAQWGLPLVIETRGDRRFSVDEVRSFEPGSETFTAPARGFVRVDADQGSDVTD
jgi:hypothetical protein